MAHIEHGLRGLDSIEDLRFVESFCKERNIEFIFKSINLETESRKRKISMELAGRQIRYDFFNDICEKRNFNKIALAHNANDQCETILMRLFRGTGLKGLKGIEPVRDNKYIRPILFVTRREVEEYCDENQIKYRIDKTNFEQVYTRNKLRLITIPNIKKEYNPNIIKTIYDFSERIKEDNDFIEDYVNKVFDDYVNIIGETVIINESLRGEKHTIIKRIIQRSFKIVSNSYEDFESVNLDGIISLFDATTGKGIDLPLGIKAYNDYGKIILGNDLFTDKSYCEELILDFNDKSIIKYERKGLKLIISLCNIKDVQKINTNSVKYFDYEKMNGKIFIRTRVIGDKFMPLGMNNYKKLKSYFIDKKVSRTIRNSIPILTVNDEIAWIIGYGQSEIFKVTNETKKVLSIKMGGYYGINN